MSSIIPVPAMNSSMHRLRWRKAEIALRKEIRSSITILHIQNQPASHTHLISKFSEHELNMRQISPAR